MILTLVAALAVAVLARPAAAVDRPVVCRNERGDAAIAACSPVLAPGPDAVAGARDRALIDEEAIGSSGTLPR
jgi:hypothetical protein